MHEPSYMSLPKAAELPVLQMDFSATAKRRLLAQGIVSALQLAELASRNPRQLKHLTGVSGTKAKRQLEAQLGILPDFNNRAISFDPIPAAGISCLKHAAAMGDMQPEESKLWLPRKVRAHLDTLSGLPTSASLTEKMQPVGNQGLHPTCVGWGSTAVCEFHLQRPMSAGFNYHGSRTYYSFPGGGSWLHFAMRHQFEVGHVSEQDYSYQQAIREEPIDHLKDVAAPARSNGWAFLDLATSTKSLPQLMRSALVGRLNPAIGPQPIAIGLSLYRSFTSTSTALDGLIPMPLPDEEDSGGHAMCVVGYVNKEDPSNPFGVSYFMVRNSWGTTWAGENPFGAPGHAMIPEAYFTNRNDVHQAIICLRNN